MLTPNSMDGSIPSSSLAHAMSGALLTTMGLRFDATHEYFFGNTSIHFWEDSDTLIIWNDMEDRIMIHGVKLEQLKDFVTRTIPNKVKPKTTRKKA